jgi:hypothetical protein
LKHFSRFIVRDKIDIALAITRFDVLQTVPFFGRRSQRFCKHFEFVRFERRLARLGQKTRSFNANEIAEVEKLENFHRLRADFLFVEISLDPPGRVPKIDKVAFAHVAMGGDAAGRAERFAFLEFFAHFGDRTGGFERAAERFHTARAKRLQFLPALRDQFILRFHAPETIRLERRPCQAPIGRSTERVLSGYNFP